MWGDGLRLGLEGTRVESWGCWNLSTLLVPWFSLFIHSMINHDLFLQIEDPRIEYVQRCKYCEPSEANFCIHDRPKTEWPLHYSLWHVYFGRIIHFERCCSPQPAGLRPHEGQCLFCGAISKSLILQPPQCHFTPAAKARATGGGDACICVFYLREPGIMGTSCFSLSASFERVNPHGGSGVNVSSPLLWLGARTPRHNMTHQRSGAQPPSPYFSVTGYADKLIPTNGIPKYFPSIKLNYPPRRPTSGFLRECVHFYAAPRHGRLNPRWCLIMLWLILHGSSHSTINVFLLACTVSLWSISQAVLLDMLVLQVCVCVCVYTADKIPFSGPLWVAVRRQQRDERKRWATLDVLIGFWRRGCWRK